MADISLWMGRAHRLLAPVAARMGELHAGGASCVLLVPEQFTLQAERELLDRLHVNSLFTLEVLSPSRLASRVLAAVGADERSPLSRAGRQMAVSYALERCEKDLKFYQTSAHRRGFTEKMAALIEDMKRGGLNPDGLGDYAQTLPEGMRRAKLADLATVFAAYETTLAGRFGDGEDQLRYLASRLPESGLFTGKHLFVYGFDALPEQMTELLCAAAAQSESLTVALLCEPQSAPDAEIYRPVRQSVDRFAAALRSRGLMLRVLSLPPEPLAHAPAIRHLDEALFAFPETKYKGPQADVFLSQHMSPFEEATFASRQILRLCAEGVEIERIAVLYPESNGYAFAVTAALSDSGLPFYTDEKLPASSHALVRFLLAALRAMAGDYPRGDVTAVMKSGYAGLSFEEACQLENYAREFGIQRKKWLTPLTKGEPQRAARCEALRARLIGPLAKARAAIVAAKNAGQSLEAVMNLLNDVHAYDTLLAEEKALLAEGMPVRAGQNSQVWQTLLELMEQLHAISNGARLPLSHLADRLECGFAAVSLAALPPASHMLHAGTLGHFLSGEMDAVFLLGLNDGVLTRGAETLLTDEERDDAQAATGCFLGMTDEGRSLFARMDVKRAMTLPRRNLYLSYAKTDPSGKALRPLDLLATLQQRLFDGLPEPPVPERELPISATQALAELSGILRGYADGAEDALPPRWRERLARLLASPATAPAAARLMRAADYRVESVPLTPADARRLFNDRTLSVSRLEEFADCPFRHFVEYGLKPEILKEWGVEPVDLGVFFHRSLQNFADLAGARPQYPALTTAETEAMADEAVAPLMQELLRGPMGETPRSMAGFERARRIVRRACVTVTRHLAAGEFRLYRAEARFGYADSDSLPPIPLRLADGTEVSLHGKIDRIDRYDQAGETYLRVIDYKSSRNTLEAAKTWWGLQLQLMVYLDAAVRGVQGAKPAGAFYFHVSDPLAPIDSDEPAAAETEIAKLLQMKGVALSDEDVLNAMDSGDTPVSIGAALAKGGGIRKDAKVLDLPQMNALLRHTRQQAETLAEALYGGDIAIRPVQTGHTVSCANCRLGGVCGFDPDARGAQTRELPEMSMDDLRQQLGGAPEPAEPTQTGNA
ncbi:MAG TPA: PD-(D/E)XK nuclease family protein [Candidatus Limiplasma sp.]|nr:PD-(D/E)XK nuclease family protein [Candidatus Limiplasma sp.]HPS80467.1 PD-(D/E)XK nuclease family protein [Candidatus Limiplasma sp.]